MGLLSRAVEGVAAGGFVAHLKLLVQNTALLVECVLQVLLLALKEYLAAFCSI